MISLAQINKAVADQLRGALVGTPFESVPISPGDLSEIERPSLKIEFDGGKLENINASFKGRTLTIRVYFFASNLKKYKLENLQVQEIIEDSFIKGVWISNYYIPVNEVNAEVNDTILQVDFDISFTALHTDYDQNSEGSGELMEDLDFDVDINS
ncbi:phage tail terminator family protein [Clostridium chromiireducens]|uniref:phage tail terminator family protein n=1 Tax=Clostridium chromiireducens TaxID=225345 RepID=UPI003AF47E77